MHSERARAKLNIRLVIEGRREDGYHLLSMLNTTITLADILEVEFGTGSSKNKFVIEGPFAAGVPAEGNLIASAAEKFAQHFGICVAPFTVKLTKNVPSGAGLGGGSSDAAAMLRVLLKEYAEPIAGWLRKSPNRPQLFDEMQKIAIQLGADVPFFLKGGLAHVGGIGEVISPLSAVNESPLFLCVPSQGISSRDFYAFLRTKYPSLPRKFDETARELAKQSSEGLSNGNLFSLMRNDFEGDFAEFCPEVSRALESCRQQVSHPVGLTGSGSVFYVVPSPTLAQPELTALLGLLESIGRQANFIVIPTNVSSASSRIDFSLNPL